MSFGFPTRSDTKWAVQPQEMAIALNYPIQEVEEFFYVSKTKVLSAVQVNAKLIFAIAFAYAKCKNQAFSH